MKTKLLPCVIWFMAGSVAAEIAPASAQYQSEGRAPVPELDRLRAEAHAAAARLAAAEAAEAERQRAAQAAALAAIPAPEAPVAPAPAVLSRRVWERVELADGRVLERARANAVDAVSVTFLHAGGATKVDRRLLPAELAEVFPFDADEAMREARARRLADQERAERADAAAYHERMKPKSIEQVRAERGATRRSVQPAPVAPSAEAIEAAVKTRARKFFENEKRTGSGATLVFGVECELEDPVELTGWANRWEVAGTAGYKVYDSIGWGSFSTRNKKFRAFVEAPPGGKIKVVDFEER